MGTDLLENNCQVGHLTATLQQKTERVAKMGQCGGKSIIRSMMAAYMRTNCACRIFLMVLTFCSGAGTVLEQLKCGRRVPTLICGATPQLQPQLRHLLVVVTQSRQLLMMAGAN